MKIINKFIQGNEGNAKKQDSFKLVKATKILPASIIESKEGAIIPKEAVALVKLQPSITIAAKKDSMLPTYALIGVIIIGLIILIRKFYKNRK